MPKNIKPPKKRIEHHGKNVRISRTGGISATKTISKGGYSTTINTNHGVRLHKRLFKGARMGFQRGNFQFIGRFNSGPFQFNISKGGVSTSIKNNRGSYNLFKPRSSSFKLGGIQIRGKNAAILQLTFLAFSLVLNILNFLWHFSVTILWLFFLSVKWFVDFLIGFYKGYKTKER
ncbi:hypothetical protein PI23P_07825 [Polaribacter irgensii 23-P]|uniref:Uncharacterized protein n=1 Tax=Polaribacter irgensii 23-P TaxID=313594 RepID=A4BZC4_9FLAO|nr:hypothetical protein [Polaribacter irgensii]EAR12517.1 hypothetical protein PI23P_07825 [Polaribacter irgensii 23-P]